MTDKRLDAPGARNISMSPKHPDQRAIESLEIAKARGIQPTCQCCRHDCKVLRGTAGTRAKFICFNALNGGDQHGQEA